MDQNSLNKILIYSIKKGENLNYDYEKMNKFYGIQGNQSLKENGIQPGFKNNNTQEKNQNIKENGIQPSVNNDNNLDNCDKKTNISKNDNTERNLSKDPENKKSPDPPEENRRCCCCCCGMWYYKCKKSCGSCLEEYCTCNCCYELCNDCLNCCSCCCDCLCSCCIDRISGIKCRCEIF